MSILPDWYDAWLTTNSKEEVLPTCDECGETVNPEDAIYFFNELSLLCPSCYKGHIHFCESCGEDFEDDEYNLELGKCVYCIMDEERNHNERIT